jgi:hypothetical protein
MNEGQTFQAFLEAQKRAAFGTDRSSKELRALSAGVRARGVFTARGTSVVFATKLKEIIGLVTAGEMDEATARWLLGETLKTLGYTPEGGFPDAPVGAVPPAVKGTLQDLSSKRRLDFIIRTQVDLMRGAGEQMRGMEPQALSQFPCWELVRVYNVRVPRDWKERWTQVGGAFYEGRMIAPKGDLLWGELGTSFEDSLDVDYPPFAFNSGMGWRPVTRAEATRLGVTSTDGRSWKDFLEGVERPQVMAGKLPLPAPRISVPKATPEMIKRIDPQAVVVQGTVTTQADKAALLAQLEARRKAREARLAALSERIRNR